MIRFALGIAAGVALVYGGLAAAFGALSIIWPERLPAPAISRLAHIDEKLRFLRDNPEFEPTLLAVGSSITWRQLAGGAFVDVVDGPGKFLNGATVLLKIHQTRDLLDFYFARYDSVQTVLILTGPPDFADCTDEPASMLDHAAATAYAFDGWPELYFYLRYFSPQRYLRGVMTLAEERTPLIGALSLDTYGSGPLQVPVSMQRGLRYGPIEPDPACAEELKELEHDLAARGLELFLVFAPIHPEYRRLNPAVVEGVHAVARDLAASAGPKTTVLWMSNEKGYVGKDFFDAFHLQWSAVQRLSAKIASAMIATETASSQLSHRGTETGRPSAPGM